VWILQDRITDTLEGQKLLACFAFLSWSQTVLSHIGWKHLQMQTN